MKGLLIKDFLVMIKLCRSQLIICLAFIAFGICADMYIMLLYVPIIIAMMPVNLVSTDEVSHWNQYSLALPFTKKSVISSKYLFSFIIAVFCILFSVGTAAYVGGGKSEIMSAAVGACFFSLVTPSIMFPLIYKYGTAKARIGFFIVIGLVTGCIFVLTNASENPTQFSNVLVSLANASPFIILGCLLLYAVSWFVCRVMYENQDI